MYTIRLAEKTDLLGISKLRASVDGGNKNFSRSSEYYNWKFFENPLGDSIVKLAINPDNEIIGMVSANFKHLTQGSSSKVRALEWGDFFTRSDYQRKGIFTALCNSILKEIHSENISFSYVRPNMNSYPIITRKLGFKDLDILEERIYVLSAKKIMDRKANVFFAGLLNVGLSIALRFSQKKPSKNKVPVCILTKEDFERMTLESNLVTNLNGDLNVYKDKEYLLWRYFNTPIDMRFYAVIDKSNIKAYLVVAFDNNRKAYIGDFRDSNEDNGEVLMDFMLNDLKSEGLESISTYINLDYRKTDRFHKLLRFYGFMRLGKNLKFAKKVHNSDVLIPKLNWHFRLGDIDGI